MAQPTLLVYNLDESLAERMQALCRDQRIQYRAVAASEFSLPIGALAGIPVRGNAVRAFVPGFSDPMLVMCHMLNPQLDAFLTGMRQAGMPRIDLKAILTPSNVAWNSRQLRDELAREHEAIRGNKG